MALRSGHGWALGHRAELWSCRFSLVRSLRDRNSFVWDKMFNMIYIPQMKIRKRTSFAKDSRRKHHHWQVTLFYKDGERFSRTYTVHAKAAGFAERQRKSPVVKMARVIEIS